MNSQDLLYHIPDESASSTVTITLSEYRYQMRICERVATLERMLQSDNYISIAQACMVLGINRKEEEGK